MSSAYLYAYDQELGHPRYHKLLARIETRILELGIKGRTVRLTPLKNLREVVSEAVEQGVQTVVAVGGDQTLSSAVAAAVGTNAVVGFIPTDSSSVLARVLGIPPLDGAVEVLSARIVKAIDVGQVNNGYFIDSAIVESPEQCSVSLKGFNLLCSRGSSLSINNVGLGSLPKGSSLYDPADGNLNLTVVPPRGRGQVTQLSLTDATVAPADDTGSSVLLDGNVLQKLPAKIKTLKSALRIIVGADRLFN